MARIVLGSRDSGLALTQARSVLSELNQEFPDIQMSQKTIRVPDSEKGDHVPTGALLEALERDQIDIALQSLDTLPLSLPEGFALVAATKRLEPRFAFISKRYEDLDGLPGQAKVGVITERDAIFLKSLRQDFESVSLSGKIDDDIGRLATNELEALILPCSSLIQQERRNRMTALLEADVFTPPAGQGALGLVVKEDNDLAFELAYFLRHRPSLDRALAERHFAKGFDDTDFVTGALASVTPDGELNLFGAVVGSDIAVQAETSGEAKEAADIGRDLAKDLLEQIKLRSQA